MPQFYGTMVGIVWYQGASRVTPGRQGAFWTVGIGSRSSALRDGALDCIVSGSFFVYFGFESPFLG